MDRTDHEGRWTEVDRTGQEDRWTGVDSTRQEDRWSGVDIFFANQILRGMLDSKVGLGLFRFCIGSV